MQAPMQSQVVCPRDCSHRVQALNSLSLDKGSALAPPDVSTGPVLVWSLLITVLAIGAFLVLIDIGLSLE